MIYINGAWRSAEIYVYTAGEWKRAEVYVYSLECGIWRVELKES
jgi:hypothetical protein